MGTFLQVLGFIFLAIILFVVTLVVGGRFFLKRRLRQFAEQVEKAQQQQGNIYEHEDIQSSSARVNDVNVIDVDVKE